MDRIFKHKKDLLADGDVNIQSLTAVAKKLERDYLRFFGGLSKLYKKGERKNEINYILGKIRRSLATIGNIVAFGSISRADIGKLINEINDINESKEVFVEEIKNTKGLRDRVEKITADTGVSPEDLNLTEDAVRESMGAPAPRKPKEPLSKTMPRTHEMASDVLKGVKGAMLGPFSQLFDVFSGLVGDVRGKRRGAAPKSDAIKKLAPVSFAGGASIPAFDMPSGEMFGGSAMQRGGALTVSLFDFFDKGAYKARWTKDVLSAMKGQKTGDGSGIGKGLELGGLVAVSAFTTAEIMKLIGTIKEFKKVRGEAKESVKKFEIQSEKGRDKYVGTKLSQIDAMAATESEKRARKAEVFKGEGKDWLKSKEASEKGLTTPEEKLFKDWKAGFKGMFGSKKAEPVRIKPVNVGTVDKSSLAARPPAVVADKQADAIQKLSKSVDELSKNVSMDKVEPNVREGAGMKSVFDSADSLISAHSNGNLSVSE